MKAYQYKCKDHSLLLPYFKNYYVSIFYRLVPRGLTANFITLISTGFVVAMLVATIAFSPGRSSIFALLLAFCLHNYLVGDHLDGMQAKFTRTSSPLGEYLDHYLDVYNGAIVVFVLTVFFAPIPKTIFYCFLFLNSIAFAITMVEELELQMLVFGKLGTLEGVIALIIFFLTWTLDPIKRFWAEELYAGYPRYWLVIGFFALGYIGTLIDVLRRMKYLPRQFVLFIAINLLLAFCLYRLNVSSLSAWIVFTLYCGEYISKVMESYLIGKRHKYPDHLVSVGAILLAILIIAELLTATSLILLILGLTYYLIAKVIWNFTVVVYQLRSHWHWINPQPSE